MREEFDVAVVGAGPAGTSAAYVLASSGVSVAIVEKARLPRYKTCGGGLLYRAVRSLPVGISPVIEREFRSVQMILSPRLRFEVHRPSPIVTMTMRDALDHLLVEAAAGKGATVLQARAVTDLQTTSDRVELKTDAGAIAAKFVIAADGAGSTIAKLAGFGDGRFMVPALECEIEVSPESFEQHATTARFDFDRIPFGYAWVFPKRSHLSVGVLSLKPEAVKLHEVLDDYLRRLSIRPLTIHRHGYVIPLSPRSAGFARSRVLLSGDAAGFADPVTAEGITFAVRSGQLAARAIVEGKLQVLVVEKTYEQLVEQFILPELRIARRLAKLLYFHPTARDAIFAMFGPRLTEAMTRIVTGESTYSETVPQIVIPRYSEGSRRPVASEIPRSTSG